MNGQAVAIKATMMATTNKIMIGHGAWFEFLFSLDAIYASLGKSSH
jgi:hypothetical protein